MSKHLRNLESVPVPEPVAVPAPAARQHANTRRLAPVVALTLMTAGLALPAYSLWSDRGDADTPTFNIGEVAFGAAPAAQTFYSQYPAGATVFNPTTATYTPAGSVGASASSPSALDSADAISAAETGPFTMSAAGGPVTIAVPGSVIAQVLNQDQLDPDCSLAASGVACSKSPIIWSFVVDGRAPQSVGLNYTVTALGQANRGTYALNNNDTGTTANWDGKGDDETLLGYSTVSIYPAGGTGTAPQCGNVPPLPPDFYDASGNPIAGAPNVYVYNAPVTDPSTYDSDAQLNEANTTQMAAVTPSTTLGTLVPGNISQPGVADAAANQQVWCVAIQFINAPDQSYNQQAYVSANGSTAQGGASSDVYTAVQQWGARVATPPSLPLAGYYSDTFIGTASGVNGSTAEDDQNWWAELYPDPNNEPDLLIQLDPTVTNINPAYPTPRDVAPTAATPTTTP